MMGRAVIGRAVASALVLISVAGCSAGAPKPNYSSASPVGSASGSVAPSPFASATTTAIPTTGPNVRPGEKPPVFDSELSSNPLEISQVFTTYYFKMIDWAYATNRPEILTPLFADNCDNCARLKDSLTSVTNAGNQISGVRTTIKQIAVVQNDHRNGAQYALDGVLDISPGRIVRGDGSLVQDVPAEPDLTVTVWLVAQGADWKVVSQGKAS